MTFRCRKRKEKSDKYQRVGQGTNITADTWIPVVGLLVVLLHLHHIEKQIAGQLTMELRQHECMCLGLLFG
jgi:hypothetical protein